MNFHVEISEIDYKFFFQAGPLPFIRLYFFLHINEKEQPNGRI